MSNSKKKDDKRIFYLKKSCNDNVNKKEELDLFTSVGTVNFKTDNPFIYNNYYSNILYIDKYYKDFLKNEYPDFDYIIKSIIKNNRYLEDINIAIGGGGNLFEIIALNKAAKEQKNRKINVVVVDKKIWAGNVYIRPEITNNLNTVTLVEGDFFEILPKYVNKIDCFVFPRSLVYAESFRSNGFDSNDEKLSDKFILKIKNMFKKLTRNNPSIVIMECDDFSKEKTKKFNDDMNKMLKEDYLVLGPFPPTHKIKIRESRMFFIRNKRS